MMGPGHSLSGAAVALGGAGVYTISTGQPIPPAVLVMIVAVMSGAALIPDLDSFTATVTKSFGFIGRALYHIFNALSLTVYNITKTRKDDDITNGHRTFTHTLVFAILCGLAVLGLTSLPGHMNLFGIEYGWGEFAALVIMAFTLHLGIAGLFAPQLHKIKSNLGFFAPYILMTFSLGVTFLISRFLPTGELVFQGLAILVAVGVAVHQLGDLITKMGVPWAWPLKLSGKRWYDISIPSFMRITAGGAVELKILVPVFSIICIAGIVIQVMASFGFVF